MKSMAQLAVAAAAAAVKTRQGYPGSLVAAVGTAAIQKKQSPSSQASSLPRSSERLERQAPEGTEGYPLRPMAPMEGQAEPRASVRLVPCPEPSAALGGAVNTVPPLSAWKASAESAAAGILIYADAVPKAECLAPAGRHLLEQPARQDRPGKFSCTTKRSLDA